MATDAAMTIDRRTPISICQLFGHSCEPFLIFSASVLYPVWDDTEHTKTTNHIQTSTNKLLLFIFFFFQYNPSLKTTSQGKISMSFTMDTCYNVFLELVWFLSNFISI